MKPGRRRLATVAVVVADYDEAIAWYTEKLGFSLIEDSALGGGKRWVVVSADSGARLLLAKATGGEQQVADWQSNRRARIPVPRDGRLFPRLQGNDRPWCAIS